MLGGQVDGGIAQSSRTAFDAWVAEVRRNLLEDSTDLMTAMSDVARARAPGMSDKVASCVRN